MSLSLLSGQDGLDVVIVQTQSLEEDGGDTELNHLFTPCVVFRVRFWICNLYFDVGQVNEARERSEVVVVQVDATQATEQVCWRQINHPVEK